MADMAMRRMSMRPIIRFDNGELHSIGVNLGMRHAYRRVAQAVRRALQEQRPFS